VFHSPRLRLEVAQKFSQSSEGYLGVYLHYLKEFCPPALVNPSLVIGRRSSSSLDDARSVSRGHRRTYLRRRRQAVVSSSSSNSSQFHRVIVSSPPSHHSAWAVVSGSTPRRQPQMDRNCRNFAESPCVSTAAKNHQR
jgi:hypothetical protein